MFNHKMLLFGGHEKQIESSEIYLRPATKAQPHDD